MVDWHLDEGYYLDAEENTVEQIETEETVDIQYASNLTGAREDTVEIEDTLDLTVSIGLDLLPLIPRKFLPTPTGILEDYVTETGIQVGTWLTRVRDIIKLLSPYTISSTKYLRHLGALIGVIFPPEDETSEEEMRKTLIHAVDWYKVKGTYNSIQIIALIQQLTLNVYDMYTNDYENFTLVDWFVGDEGENPLGLDSSYYKSPHFAIESLLNKVYVLNSVNYLWYPELLENLKSKVDETRPAHTVPHYIVLLNPKTDEFGHVVEVDGEILTKIISNNWQYGTKYFDMDSSQLWNFDETPPIYFDSSEEAFIKSITKFIIGTGNYPSNIENSGFCIESPIYTGIIDSDNITITGEKYQWECIIPKNIELDEASELGLYIPGSPDTFVIGSTFPKIIKDTDTELHIIVEIFKRDLS